MPASEERLSRETTEGREGFVNPMSNVARADEATVSLSLRDFDREKLTEHEHLVCRFAEQAAATYPGARLKVEVVEVYRNMKEYLEDHPRVTVAARTARASPNGACRSRTSSPAEEEDFHSRHEWICVADMGAAVATIVHLAQI